MINKMLILLLVLLTGGAIGQTIIDSTNIYTFTFKGNKYEVIKEPFSWIDAAKIADERGGILAEINSQEEQDTIFHYLNNAEIDNSLTRAPDGGGGAYIWIGGNDINEEGVWVWDGNNDGISKQFWEGATTGNLVGGLFSNWGNEPDDFSGQDALGLGITSWPRGIAGQWNDVGDENELFSLIEYDNSTFKVKNIEFLHDEFLLNIEVNFLFSYDSVHVMVDSNIVKTLFNLSQDDSAFTCDFNPMETGVVLFNLRAFRDTIISLSNPFEYTVFSFANPIDSYSSDFEDLPIDDFLLENFEIIRGPGFRNKAIHSLHNYEDSSEAVLTLRKPIIVDQIKSQISFSEVAIVEPGDSGSSFGDEEFNDYVIVEGSKKANEWLPLISGYDAGKYSDWETAWENPTLYRNLMKEHSIELTDAFNAGDTILIRFRLFSDEEINGWGWVIDSLQIQEFPLTDIKDDYTISRFSLEQNYPNPFNPSTTIKYSIPVVDAYYASATNVVLKIYSILGQEITTLVNKEQRAGSYEVQFNASNLTSGIYFYMLQSGSFLETKKLLLLK